MMMGVDKTSENNTVQWSEGIKGTKGIREINDLLYL
jgi:hypothetical protein